MTTILLALFAGTSLGGLIFLYLILRTLKRRRILRGFTFFFLALLMFMTALAALLMAVGVKGYKALVREDLAAMVYITPLGSQQFQARVVQPHVRDTLFAVAGDELYIDARVLKWKPIINFLGLHTAYHLDRVGGRYLSLQDEKTKVRTMYSLDGGIKPWDIFFLRTRYNFLAPILDAQYGSATFAPVQGASAFMIMVTTSGLITRTK
jgi:hypothetical protein